MAHVRDKIDFADSDIGLIGSRLMDICREDIETFQNYPAWTEKLEQVYRKKDIAAKYALMRSLLLKAPEDIPSVVWDAAAFALLHCRDGDLDPASAQLDKAVEEYKKSTLLRIDALISACVSLQTFPDVSAEDIRSSRSDLERLSKSLTDSLWPDDAFADEYNRRWARIKGQEDAIRDRLAGEARQLKKEIIDSRDKAAGQSYFYESRKIGRYIALARQYDRDDADASIANWMFVEDLSRLSDIVGRMRGLDSVFEKMFARKEQFDLLSADIDKAIIFCEEFKGISAQEKQKYMQWGADLNQLKAEFAAPLNNVPLIDRPDDVFAGEHEKISSAFAEIRAKLPYHRSRVIELIDRTHSLEAGFEQLLTLQQHWSDISPAPNALAAVLDFTQTRAYLEGIKNDVDNWPAERFNRQIRDSCKILGDALQKQSIAAAGITSAILNEKSRLIKGIASFRKRHEEILADRDIRELDTLAAAGGQDALLRFRQLPEQLSADEQELSTVTVDSFEASTDTISASAADFELDPWLVGFIADKNRLDTQISRLQAIRSAVSAFHRTSLALSQQSSIETGYYTALRDFTAGLIDYSDLVAQLDAIMADKAVARMCDFLSRIRNDASPRLADCGTSLAAMGKDLTNLKSMKTATLSEAKDFNGKRKQLLSDIAALRQDLKKLDRANLEGICRQAVTQSVDKIKSLIGAPGPDDALQELTLSLWDFMPEHRQWEQWSDFLRLYHLIATGGGVSLASSSLLMPAAGDGATLSLEQIARDPAAAFTPGTGETANFGWPRYLSHQNDKTVIMAFVSGVEARGLRPFYMSVRETTNAQYVLFLEQTGAKPTTKLAGWSYFGDQSNKLLIGQAQGQFPPSRITWDSSAAGFLLDENFKNAPVTYVTLHGAQTYAQWLGAGVPTAGQHAYAALAGAATAYPWSDRLEDAASYAHVRSGAWQKAARQYNANRDNPVEIAYPPVGAVRDFLPDEALDPAGIVNTQGDDLPVWPCLTTGIKPNAWGLYDLIGNAWEWCIDENNASTPVICGGSCLSPLRYVAPESKYEFKNQACDVGFRLVIPAE